MCVCVCVRLSYSDGPGPWLQRERKTENWSPSVAFVAVEERGQHRPKNQKEKQNQMISRGLKEDNKGPRK